MEVRFWRCLEGVTVLADVFFLTTAPKPSTYLWTLQSLPVSVARCWLHRVMATYLQLAEQHPSATSFHPVPSLQRGKSSSLLSPSVSTSPDGAPAPTLIPLVLEGLVWLWSSTCADDTQYAPSAGLFAYISVSKNASFWLLGRWCVNSILKKKKNIFKIRSTLFYIQSIMQKVPGSSGWQACQSGNQCAGSQELRGFVGPRTTHSRNQTSGFLKFTCWLQRKSPLKSKSFKAQPSFKPQGTCFLWQRDGTVSYSYLAFPYAAGLVATWDLLYCEILTGK